MLSILSCAYWPFVYLPRRSGYSDTLSIVKFFIYLFLDVLGLHCFGLSLVEASTDCSSVAVTQTSHCGGFSLQSMGTRVHRPQ